MWFVPTALGFDMKKKEVVKLVHDADPGGKTTGEGMVDFNVFLDIMSDKYSERDPTEEVKKVSCGKSGGCDARWREW